MKKLIEVTERDILEGGRGNRICCPVALAVRRSLGRVYVSVGLHVVQVNECLFDLPALVSVWIGRYDDHLPVVPMSFELDMEDRI